MFTLSHRPSYPWRGRICLKVLLIVFIFGYYYKSAIPSFADYNSKACNHHMNFSPRLPFHGLSYREQEYAQSANRKLAHRNLQTPIDSNDYEAADVSIAQALENILSILPDESDINDLIGPIEGTGEEKLREVGFRARIFKASFEAWEALHLRPIQDQIFVYENTLQYLKRNTELSARLKWDHNDMTHVYEKYRYFLTRLSMRLFPWTMPYFPDLTTLHSQFWNGDQGLVFTAGNHQALYLLTSIQSLRKMGCELPIEVMYLGDSDLGEEYRRKLEAINGVITRDLSSMINDEGWKLAGWAAKPFAILLSSFREAIFIDADSLFLRDPAVLFQDPGYQSTGALFFKDRIFQPAFKKSWLKRILPTPVSSLVRKNRFWTGESSHMQESGVVVVDKWKHFSALLVICRMNGPDRDGNKDEGRVGVYDMVFGDKETFWLGWELVGDTGYAFHDGNVAVMGTAEVEQPSDQFDEREAHSHELRDIDSQPTKAKFTICAPQMLHLDMAGRPLWFNGWVLPNKFSGDPHLQPVNFESFLGEPSDVGGDGAWKLRPSNVFCLSADHLSNFTTAEKSILDSMVELAKGVGAISVV